MDSIVTHPSQVLCIHTVCTQYIVGVKLGTLSEARK